MSNIVGGIDISRWATGSSHEENVAKTYQKIKRYISGVENSSYLLESVINNIIQNNPTVKGKGGSPVTAKMIIKTASKYNIDPALIMAIAEMDSHYGVVGKAIRTKNPGNWGNDDAGNLRFLSTWEEGIDKIGMQLDRYRKKGNTNETPTGSAFSITSTTPTGSASSITSTTPASAVSEDSELVMPVDLISEATKKRWALLEEEKRRVAEANLRPTTLSGTKQFLPLSYIEMMKSSDNKTNITPPEKTEEKLEETKEVPELFTSIFNNLEETPISKFVAPSFIKKFGGNLKIRK